MRFHGGSNENPTNFELSPCRVTYGGVDIGATLGNVAVKTKIQLSDLKSYQASALPVIDKHVSGHSFTIETEFAEDPPEAKLEDPFPHE